ncbi:hypothetical protein GDO81_022991 [Engystomops pustulosus]|uniref:Uncharacterized protein n=1 Tax=Engystomops pustulosus TaxID=76066 RepID=A0AAV6ZSM8_ENGPU|nr:hypothetical protein GDO81_022991 [Engystomops pustulosus]
MIAGGSILPASASSQSIKEKYGCLRRLCLTPRRWYWSLHSRPSKTLTWLNVRNFGKSGVWFRTACSRSPGFSPGKAISKVISL